MGASDEPVLAPEPHSASPEPQPPGRAVQGVRIALASGVLALITQFENYWFHAPRDVTDPYEAVWFAARLPFILLDHAAIALAFAVAYVVTARGPWTRLAFWATWCTVQLYVVVDQVGYKLLADHIKRTQVDAELADTTLVARELLSSAAAELEWWMIANGGLALCLCIGLNALAARPPSRLLSALGRARWTLRAAFVLYVGLGLWATTEGERHNLERHPLVALVASFRESAPAQIPYSQLLAAQLHRPSFGTFAEDPADTRALAEARDAIRRRPRRPFVLLYVLESVGTRQLFSPTGRQVTPYLSELARSSVRFEAIYPSFPSTARAHIPMMTGGPTITWGDYMAQAGAPYTGPNLLGELRRLGYRTGVFSPGDLAYEKLGMFYGGLKPDKLAYYNDGQSGMDPEAKINSWGVSSDEVLKAVERWLDESAGRPEPMFLAFLTLETHHPYSYPYGHTRLLAGNDKRSQYYNALNYSDAVLRRLALALARRGLWDDALVLVTGDHGEAFGDIHRGNFVHRNYLYEENIRSFLVVSDRHALRSERVSLRPGSNGDVGPTLLSLLGATDVTMPGHDLFAPTWELRTQYFHKTATPYRWGLVDGRWKYIASMAGERPQLFDLEVDPTEQKNVAPAHLEKTRRYQELCATWYVKTGYDFQARLAGYTPPAGGLVLRGQLRERPEPGIDRVMFGMKSPTEGIFVEPNSFAPEDLVEVQIDWRPFETKQRIDCVIEPPDGVIQRTAFELEPDTPQTLGPLGATSPLQPGTYRVAYWVGDRKLIDGTFEVLR